MKRTARIAVALMSVVAAACPAKSDDAAKDSATATSTSTAPTATTTAATATTTAATAASSAPASSSATAVASAPPPANPGSAAADVGASAPAGFVKFTSASGGYEVMLPSTPQESDVKLKDGTVQHQALSKTASEVLVAWQETKIKDIKALEVLRDTATKNLESPTTKPIKIAGKYDGFEVAGKTKDSKKDFREQLFAVEDRFYQIIIAGGSDADARTIFDSFKLASATTGTVNSDLPAICNDAVNAMRACGTKMGGPGGKAMKEAAQTLADGFKTAAKTAPGRKALETSCAATLKAQQANPLCK